MVLRTLSREIKYFMRNNTWIRIFVSSLICCCLAFSAQASFKLGSKPRVRIIEDYDYTQYDAVIDDLYNSELLPSNNDLSSRIEIASRRFLGKPYLLGALGEGKDGVFDRRPIYRTDQFDCLTYVSTVLALAQSENLADFKQKLPTIRYKNGKPKYVERNHFTSVDWNINNAKKGYIKDVTLKIVDKSGNPVAKRTNTYIDKKSWYQSKTARSLKFFDKIPRKQVAKYVAGLHNQAELVQNTRSDVPYIPLDQLFNKQGQANNHLFDQIPHGSIIQIVRPNWDIDDEIGTRLDISHLGFAIKTPQGLMFREASSLKNQVVDISLKEYLQGYLNSPTIEGINIQLPIK